MIPTAAHEEVMQEAAELQGVVPSLGHGRWKDVVVMSLPFEHQRHCGYFSFLWTAVD